MANVVYTCINRGRERRYTFERVLVALNLAVLHLHDRLAELVTITWGAHQLYDRAAIERV
jgi:hypothetical protein